MAGGVSPEFVVEAQEIVDTLNRDLIAAEAETRTRDEVEPGRVNTLFRSAHSLKGLAGMFGLDAMSRLAHDLESVLDSMRLGKLRLDAFALDVLFSCVEIFGELIDEASRGIETPLARVDAVVGRLAAIVSGDEGREGEEPLESLELGEDVLSVLTEYEEHRLRENVVRGRNLFVLRTSFQLSNFDVGLAEIDNTVKTYGEVITKLPSSKAAEPGAISFDIIVGSDATASELQTALSDDRIEVVPIRRRGVVTRPIEGREAAAKPAPIEPEIEMLPTTPDGDESEEPTSLRSVSRTVRVDIRRLDRLMNLVGELGLTRAAFSEITEEMKRTHGFTGLAVDLHKESRNFERRLAELQAGIMEVRMVPLANLFERMVRVGRKISRELNKEVHIETAGEHTELDKLIVEDLAEPLMHIIRNAIDHGLEGPEERHAVGKRREGIVRLSAAAQGNHVLVEVSDDGRGIDVQRTLETAIMRGLITADRAEEMSLRDVYGLLFQPGFSTAAKVSQFSGRGVGMDVVRNNISKLSGVVDVRSEEGRGTTFTITLPITLAIIPALVVAVSDETYAIPLNNVQETLSIADADVRTIERREVITVRGATVPLVNLRELFGLRGERRPAASYGVVAGVGQSRMALLVDDLVGQQDIVIKSLGRWLKNTQGIAGATELGNQQTILVIDMVQLINEMAEVEGRGTGVALQ